MLVREVVLVSEDSNVSQNEEPCITLWLKYPVKQSKSDSHDRKITL